MGRPTVDINDDPNAPRATVDGLYQGDRVRVLKTGQTGTITFACPRDHESHVRLDSGHVDIYPNPEIERIDT